MLLSYIDGIGQPQAHGVGVRRQGPHGNLTLLPNRFYHATGWFRDWNGTRSRHFHVLVIRVYEFVYHQSMQMYFCCNIVKAWKMSLALSLKDELIKYTISQLARSNHSSILMANIYITASHPFHLWFIRHSDMKASRTCLHTLSLGAARRLAKIETEV